MNIPLNLEITTKSVEEGKGVNALAVMIEGERGVLSLAKFKAPQIEGVLNEEARGVDSLIGVFDVIIESAVTIKAAANALAVIFRRMLAPGTTVNIYKYTKENEKEVIEKIEISGVYERDREVYDRILRAWEAHA